MKKIMLFLLVVMIIGYFIPTGVFAESYRRAIDRNLLSKFYNYNVDIDYSFKVGNDSNDNLKFKLYDKTNTFNFVSYYDQLSRTYFFKDNNSNNFSNYNTDLFNYLDSLTYEVSPYSNNYDYSNIHYPKLLNFEEIENYKFNISDSNDEFEFGSFVSAYSVLPMILEETTGTGFKKIVFSTIHLIIYADVSNEMHYFCELSFINKNNHTSIYDTDGETNVGRYRYDRNLYFGHNYNHIYCNDYLCYTYSSSTIESNVENIKFMRNSAIDYSDELWNKYNSEKIASSEITLDDDNSLEEPYIFRANSDKGIYSKYKSNVNYRFKVKNGNGMNFKLHDISNTFNFSSKYDKDSDTYSIVDNSTDTDYQDGIKEFSKIIIDEVKNGNFSGLANKYKSITSDNCTSTNCNIYTYIPLILEGDNKDTYAKQIVLGLVDIQYRQENSNDYYDIGLNVYNNTCDLLNSNIDADMSQLINLSRAIEKDYSTSLMNQYSDGSIALDDIYDEVDVNTLKDEYCNDIPIITLRQNPKTFNNGVLVLIISMIMMIGSCYVLIKKKS